MIELKNAGFNYGGRDILSDMTLRLSPGSFHFLTGPSGSGKTTLLNLCYQALMPTTGMVRIFEQDVRAMTRDDVARVRRRIGVVHQNCQFLDHISVRDNLTLPLAVSGRESEVDQGNVDDLLSWVGLSERGDALPPELSGGERQRAALARAIIMSPDLILADEPTGNVDWEMAQRLIALLVELNRMGKTILIATHDLNLIRNTKSEVSARVLRINNTKLQLAGADL
ncbi:cell division ATP-binding protein FtsE [Neptunicoccus cionae]|uniref:cell division ATP-binding protein FtsE n=1 Tax=Neptunicoccus cionae TaxID=2035344 RepID=UPI000C7736F2|nr:ATP-binding cassette domain-containing protein [Amylibacter cionae]MBR9865366.1 ATP-binding cassette domain-containing protein [Paracoccaceae bacterium]PLS23132.1 cell division protein FtsE [Amylibacter cionae]